MGHQNIPLKYIHYYYFTLKTCMISSSMVRARTFTLSSPVLGEATLAFTLEGALSVETEAIGTFVGNGTFIYVCQLICCAMMG